MHLKKLLAFSTAITLSLSVFAPSSHAINPGEGSKDKRESPTQLTRDPDYDTTAAHALDKVTSYSNRWKETHPIATQTSTERLIQRFLEAVTNPDNTAFANVLTTVQNSESLDRKLPIIGFTYDDLRVQIQNILGKEHNRDAIRNDIIQMRGDARPERTQPKNVAPPEKTEATEFYTNIEFFVRRLYNLARICEMNSTTSATETAKTRKRTRSMTPSATRRAPSPVAPITPVVPELITQRERGASLPPTRTAKRRAPSPVAPVAPVVPETAARKRAKSMTSTAKRRAPSPVAPIAPVVPETTARKRENSLSPTRTAKARTLSPAGKAAAAATSTTPAVPETATRGRSKSVTSLNNSECFLTPLKEYAANWKEKYYFHVSCDDEMVSCIDKLCAVLSGDTRFVTAFQASWGQDRKYVSDTLDNTTYIHLREVISDILGTNSLKRKDLLHRIHVYNLNAIESSDIRAGAFYFNVYVVLNHMDDLFPKRLAK